MAHLHKKIKKGRPYYYVREIQRVNGKPTVVNQVYLGSPERILELFRVREIARRFFSKVRETVSLSGDCFLFDTTNYYTYLSSKTLGEPTDEGLRAGRRSGLGI